MRLFYSGGYASGPICRYYIFLFKELK